MSIVYLDTETTGLDPQRHEVWEIAYAIDGTPIRSAKVVHHGLTADPEALAIGHYVERSGDMPHAISATFELNLIDIFAQGYTLCGANPAFDAAFLKARWGVAPWKYRLLDIEAYAMGALGYSVPKGLKDVAADLVQLGHNIPTPDHTAAGDVATLRECHWALQTIYGATTTNPPRDPATVLAAHNEGVSA